MPITAASYDGIPPSRTDQASALLNAARNTGGSIGVSLASNVLMHHEPAQSRLVEHVSPANPAYQEALNQATHYFAAQGANATLAQMAETKKKLPELPEARRARLVAEYEIALKDAGTLTAERAFADRFEAAARTAKNPRRVANVLLNEVGGRLKALGLEQAQSPVSMAGIVLAADLLDEGKISSKQLKQLFDVCFEKGEDFPAVYEREKPEQITDATTIEALIDEVIAANPKQVEQYRAGKKTMAGFFVGQVMRASRGQANPALLNELVTKKLDR